MQEKLRLTRFRVFESSEPNSFGNPAAEQLSSLTKDFSFREDRGGGDDAKERLFGTVLPSFFWIDGAFSSFFLLLRQFPASPSSSSRESGSGKEDVAPSLFRSFALLDTTEKFPEFHSLLMAHFATAAAAPKEFQDMPAHQPETAIVVGPERTPFPMSQKRVVKTKAMSNWGVGYLYAGKCGSMAVSNQFCPFDGV